MEQKSIRRLGASRPRKGVKVVDLSAKRVGQKKPDKKILAELFIGM